jgi:hypothetical protein
MDAASTVVTKNFRIGIPPLPWHLALAENLHGVAGNVDRADRLGVLLNCPAQLHDRD